ncbi:phage head closure protein [Enterococcus termitis]|uniref:Phage head-tail adapter protein n=1 Tax=Enterococcus termitis TaxID=332950 RepID=A0A1E5GU05_9ENTE|nr:phage head closure protein [Enterococcus termitis]OEG16174.1 hypothetical protein BCR25_18435 [Enterococcus termitis]
MNELTWDDEVTLLTDVYTEDKLGQPIKGTPKKEIVCCCKRPIGRSDHWAAGQNGIKLQQILIVHPYEYDGQATLIYEGEKLRVVDTYPINQEELELKCTQKIGDQNG